jgi:hypothetical protein
MKRETERKKEERGEKVTNVPKKKRKKERKRESN